ncbi:MAG: TolC family protein, partial [Rubripirellula sp.]
LCEQQRSVRHQISDAYAEVSSSYASLQTSQAEVDATEQRLAASEALFAADKIQIEFLLDAQEELLRSRVQLATDIARYTTSLININAATGTLLDDIGVFIRKTCAQTELIYLPEQEYDSATEI